MVLRHEGACGRRCGERPRTHCRGHVRQRVRREGDGPPDPRERSGGVRRQGLRQRHEETVGKGRRRAVVGEKARPGRTLSASQRGHNRRFGKVRAKIEHVFRGVKCQFGYRLVRYRGIANNDGQMFSLLALANLYLARGSFVSREAGRDQKAPANFTAAETGAISAKNRAQRRQRWRKSALIRGSLGNL